MTSPTPLPSVTPSQAITRLQLLSQGARILMTGLLGSGTLLLLLLPAGPDNPVVLLFVGLHSLQGGFTMIVAVGALSCHRIGIEQEQRTQALIAQHERHVDEQVQKLEQLCQDLASGLRRIEQLVAGGCANVEEIREIESRILAAAECAGEDELSLRRSSQN